MEGTAGEPHRRRRPPPPPPPQSECCHNPLRTGLLGPPGLASSASKRIKGPITFSMNPPFSGVWMFPGALGLKTRQPLLLGRWRRYQPSGAPGGRGPRRPFGSSAATPPAGFGPGESARCPRQLRSGVPEGDAASWGAPSRSGGHCSGRALGSLGVPERRRSSESLRGTLLVTALELAAALVGMAAGSKELGPHTGPWMRKFPSNVLEAWAGPTGCLDLHGNGGAGACGYAPGFPRGI